MCYIFTRNGAKGLCMKLKSIYEKEDFAVDQLKSKFVSCLSKWSSTRGVLKLPENDLIRAENGLNDIIERQIDIDVDVNYNTGISEHFDYERLISNAETYSFKLNLLEPQAKFIEAKLIGIIIKRNQKLLRELSKDSILIAHYIDINSKFFTISNSLPYGNRFITFKPLYFSKLNFSIVCNVKKATYKQFEKIGNPERENKSQPSLNGKTINGNIKDIHPILTEIKIINLCHLDFICYSIIKPFLLFYITKNTRHEILYKTIYKKYCCKSNNEEKYFLTEMMKSQIISMYKTNLENFNHLEGNTSNEPRGKLDLAKSDFLKNLKKNFKRNDISCILNYLKPFYSRLEFSNYILFSFYLIHRRLYNKDFKIYTNFFIEDIKVRIDSWKGNNIDEIIDISFLKKVSVSFNCSFKHENSVMFLYLLLSLILNQSNSSFANTNTSQIKQDFRNDSIQFKFILFLQKFITMISKNDKKKDTSHIKFERNLITSTSNLDSSINIKSKSILNKIKKELINFISVYINENKEIILSCYEKMIILSNLKFETRGIKRIVIEKLLILAGSFYSQSISSLIIDFKYFWNSGNVCENNKGKIILENLSHINKSFFTFIFSNCDFDEENLTFAKSFFGIKSLSENIFIFLTCILQKNRKKSEIMKFIINDFNGDSFSMNKNKILIKYGQLIESTKILLLNFFILYQIYQLFCFISNFEIFSKDSKFEFYIMRCLLLISFYFSYGFPNKEILFLSEISTTFLNYLERQNFEESYIKIFYSYADFTYQRGNSQEIFEKINHIIKQKSLIFFDQMKNLNQRNKLFMDNSKRDLVILYDHLLKDNWNGFREFIELFFTKNSPKFSSTNQIVSSDVIAKIKKEKRYLDKDTSASLLEIESLFEFRKLFSSEKNNLHFSQTCAMKFKHGFTLENTKNPLQNKPNFEELSIMNEGISIANIPTNTHEDLDKESKIYLRNDSNSSPYSYDQKFIPLNTSPLENCICVNSAKQNKLEEDYSDYSMDNLSNISEIEPKSPTIFKTSSNTAEGLYNNLDLQAEYDAEVKLFEPEVVQDFDKNYPDLKKIIEKVNEDNLKEITKKDIKIERMWKKSKYTKERKILLLQVKTSYDYNFKRPRIEDSYVNSVVMTNNDLKRKYIAIKFLINIIKNKDFKMMSYSLRVFKLILNNLKNEIEMVGNLKIMNKDTQIKLKSKQATNHKTNNRIYKIASENSSN